MKIDTKTVGTLLALVDVSVAPMFGKAESVDEAFEALLQAVKNEPKENIEQVLTVHYMILSNTVFTQLGQYMRETLQDAGVDTSIEELSFMSETAQDNLQEILLRLPVHTAAKTQAEKRRAANDEV